MFRKDRTKSKGKRANGGGVAIFARNTLQPVAFTPECDIGAGLEAILAAVRLPGQPKTVVVGAAYRPPQCRVDSFAHFRDILEALTLANKDSLILGDLNSDMLNPGRGSAHLASALLDLGFTQLIDKPTRVTESSSTCIDLVMTNKPDMIASTKTRPCSFSDHHLDHMHSECHESPRATKNTNN